MISDRKLTANKRNASLSTGPRTLGGKLRSRNNAIRHGLAVRIDSDSAVAQNIDSLTRILAGFSNDFWRNEYARTVAECHFEMQRIRAARTMVLQRIGKLEASDINEHALAVATIEKISRYERRVLSRRRKALRDLNSAVHGVADARKRNEVNAKVRDIECRGKLADNDSQHRKINKVFPRGSHREKFSTAKAHCSPLVRMPPNSSG